jgi:hypothetical protein
MDVGGTLVAKPEIDVDLSNQERSELYDLLELKGFWRDEAQKKRGGKQKTSK